MKKLTLLLLSLLVVLALAACGAPAQPDGGGQTPAGEGQTLSQLMADILTDVPDLPDVWDISVEAETFSSYLFIEPIEGAEALASEAKINAIPHSVVLLRLPEGTDAETVAEQIRQNANPNKWICVSADQVEVTVNDQLVLLVMSTAATAQAIGENFAAL